MTDAQMAAYFSSLRMRLLLQSRNGSQLPLALGPSYYLKQYTVAPSSQVLRLPCLTTPSAHTFFFDRREMGWIRFGQRCTVLDECRDTAVADYEQKLLVKWADHSTTNIYHHYLARPEDKKVSQSQKQKVESIYRYDGI